MKPAVDLVRGRGGGRVRAAVDLRVSRWHEGSSCAKAGLPRCGATERGGKPQEAASHERLDHVRSESGLADISPLGLDPSSSAVQWLKPPSA